MFLIVLVLVLADEIFKGSGFVLDQDLIVDKINNRVIDSDNRTNSFTPFIKIKTNNRIFQETKIVDEEEYYIPLRTMFAITSTQKRVFIGDGRFLGERGNVFGEEWGLAPPGPHPSPKLAELTQKSSVACENCSLATTKHKQNNFFVRRLPFLSFFAFAFFSLLPLLLFLALLFLVRVP